MKPKAILALCVLAVLAVSASRAADIDLAALEKRVTVEKLDNGLTLLVYERPEAPVVSFFTHVDVGSAQEVPGITGLAHMFEHMAFKGTSHIGTSDFAAEKRALEQVDRAYADYDRERRRQGGPDADKLAKLEQAFKQAQEEAERYVVKNEFGEIVDRAGGVGLNAFTNADTTGYSYSLPANKVELWAYLESERFLDPSFRQFYKERDVVMEERRMRTESQPVGRLIEQLVTTAFQAHPYRQPTVGYMSDLKSFTREDAEAFHRTYYVPSNITVAVVGDVKAATLLPLLRKYFSRLPAGPEPPELRTEEPKQIAEKTIKLPDPAQPMYVEGYHRPAATHADDAIYNAMADVLSTGRTSRLYRNLVRDKKIAAVSAAFNGFPGDKYPNLMVFYGVPTPGHTNEEIQLAIRSEIERLRTEPVDAEELRMVKTRAKANLIRGLNSNTSLAGQLATYQAQYGDWRELFRSVEKIDRVTSEDILRVAQATFVPINRIAAMIVNDGAGSAAN